MQHVFVLQLDAFHRALLESLPAAAQCTFHGLLERVRFRAGDRIPITDLLDQARASLDRFVDSVDGVMGYWDFPGSCMVPILCSERGLPTVALDAVVRCEHKYWSREIQRTVVPEQVPAYRLVDPFDNTSLTNIDLDYPFWLKPIKSWNAYLGFLISGPDDLQRHIVDIRAGIQPIADAFNYVLDRVLLPEMIAPVRGHFCIAEQIISAGHQCTLEGFVYGGRVETIGIVDSIRVPGRSTFARYQYPSRLPAAVQQKIADTAARLMPRYGFEGGHFNIEFFWDQEQQRLWILEINSRVSQSHSALFQDVDGLSNHAVILDLALGRRPCFPKGRGPYACAAKFYYRRYEDALVTQAPDDARIAQVCNTIDGVRVRSLVHAGMRLSELPAQESYSYEVAWIYTAGQNESELIDKYERAVQLLGFTFQDTNSEH